MTYSDRFAKIADPTVMNLLKHTETPNLISFAGGTPNPEALPLNLIKEALSIIEPNPQYTPTQGILSLRETLAKMYSVTPESILITSGSQQALDLVGRVFINPGDKMYVTNPTYFAALYAFNAYGSKYVSDLESANTVYVIPNFGNPTGETMDLTARKQFSQSNKLILEDDPYGQLYFDAKPPQSIYSLNSDKTIYLTSLSKIVGSALRIGIVIGKPETIEALTRAKTGMDLCTSGLLQQISNYVLSHPDYPNYLNAARSYYKNKCQTMLSALTKYMPKEASWTSPAGGMFIWMTLPESIDTQELYYKALEQNIAFVPGYIFQPFGGKSSSLRLSFALPTSEQINTGTEKLAKLIC
ncbi:PLP-dependent aminotransferase family protein [Candidatus Amesbacteria bacterium]|nr:PLP-dependent aminotransferase family protein [Candidatus Amesbacteria bacterium]